MKMPLTAALAITLVAFAGPGPAFPAPQAQPPGGSIQPVSWDGWLAAKAKAESRDAAGDLVGALQYYLEYVRQAEGLNNPARVAWGKNNAAYMIIKMHQEDQTVDLAPAKRLLEEGLALPGATEDCRKILAMNLEHVKASLASSR